jgi:hypothetical protein
MNNETALKEAAVKAAEIIDRMTYKEIGSDEYRVQENIIYDFEGAYYAGGVNVENPDDKDIARYYANIRRLQFDPNIPGVLKNTIGFIPDMYAYSPNMYNALTEHRTYKDDWYEDDEFYKAVDAIFEAKTETELAEAEKRAMGLAELTASYEAENTIHKEKNTMSMDELFNYVKENGSYQYLQTSREVANDYGTGKDSYLDDHTLHTAENLMADKWFADEIGRRQIDLSSSPFWATVWGNNQVGQYGSLENIVPIKNENDLIKMYDSYDDSYGIGAYLQNITLPGTEQTARQEQEFPEAEQTLGNEAEAPEQGQEPMSPEERAFLNAIHQRKQIAESLKNGSHPCLPGADGCADTTPAVNLTTGTRYHGANLLYLKDFQKRNGFPTAEYATADAIKQSGVYIKKGEKGVDINISTLVDENTGQWENKTVRLFNAAQTTRPWELKKYAENLQAQKEQERQEFLKSQYGDAYKPREKKEKEPGPEISCSSTEPERYLSQYLAAVSLGGTFKASPQQAGEFVGKMQERLYERNTEQHIDPFKLSKICNEAGVQCKEIIREIKQPQPKQEQTLERKQSRHL